jgi:hypothetical protein
MKWGQANYYSGGRKARPYICWFPEIEMGTGELLFALSRRPGFA